LKNQVTNTSGLAALFCVLALGCGPQEDCGLQECPVGTSFSEYQSSRNGFDVSVEYNPSTYDGEVAFASFGESECRFDCVAIQACPEDSYPVITDDCFTCAVLVNDEEMVQPECP
jgi:hypothetical protein